METEQEALIHWFQPDQAPEAVFALADGQKAKAVYAYCNLHGLWKQNLEIAVGIQDVYKRQGPAGSGSGSASAEIS